MEDTVKTMRVCIGSNDDKNIAQSHMGDTDFFHIYDIFENTEPVFVEKRKNVTKDIGHAASDKMKKILGIIADCDILVATRKSPNFVKIANKTKYQPVVIKTPEMAVAFSRLQKAFQTLSAYVSRRRTGERFGTIPEL